MQHQYHSINTEFIDNDSYPDETGPNDWSKQRFENVIGMREAALEHARNIWADYLFVSHLFSALISLFHLSFFFFVYRRLIAMYSSHILKRSNTSSQKT